jgi:hypothetical protein
LAILSEELKNRNNELEMGIYRFAVDMGTTVTGTG